MNQTLRNNFVHVETLKELASMDVQVNPLVLGRLIETVYQMSKFLGDCQQVADQQSIYC